jgi:mycothiol synthase
MEERMKIALPTGLTSQPACLKDADRAVKLYNTFGTAYLGGPTENREDMMAAWQTPGYVLATDTCMVLAPDGECVAFGDFWDKNEKHSNYNVWIVVHPQYEGQGIGSYLLNWAEDRAQKSLPLAPAEARVVMQQGVDARLAKGIDFLSQHDFNRVRNFYHMHIELDQPPPAASVSNGFIIRPFKGEDERRELLRALHEAFRDHWGFVDEPFENYYQRWMHRARQLKELDPGLWYVAIQDGTIAGGSLCATARPEDPEMGWIHTLGIRRPYRKQGLGLALLHTAFGEFYRRGKKRVGLGVDASSLTGAVRLYEKAGMHIARQFITFEKILREGEELSTQQLSAE